MRGFVIVALWLAIVLAPGFAAAQEAEALRRELDQLRRQQEQYQKAIEALSDRLKRLESQPAPAAVAPAPPGPGSVAADTVRAAASGTPIADRPGAAPRAVRALRPAGQRASCCSTSASSATSSANLTQRNVDKANAGTFAGRENRFFPREVELSLFGQIDPYARAEVRIESGEEEAGAREIGRGAWPRRTSRC